MIAVACDHGAVEMKEEIEKLLDGMGLEYQDFGTDSHESVDYPIYAARAAHAVANGECDRGIVMCGTGIGMSLAANKVHGIRCALINLDATRMDRCFDLILRAPIGQTAQALQARLEGGR